MTAMQLGLVRRVSKNTRGGAAWRVSLVIRVIVMSQMVTAMRLTNQIAPR